MPYFIGKENTEINALVYARDRRAWWLEIGANLTLTQIL